MKLFHCADIHLGRRRLDGRLPDSDFADAFAWLAGEAITGKADAFLLAGDLFDRPQVEPHHLRQAQTTLQRLRDAAVPVIAIEGNHDRAFLHSFAATWLDFLADDGLLRLLKPRFDAGGAILDGACLDLGGLRFVGAGYLGAATPHKVRQILERLEPGRDHVMLLHAGPDYFVGEGGGFSTDDLRGIRERVRYLALGHIHKPMLHGGWACNPGSPENCELREAAYDHDRSGAAVPRGFAWIELAPGEPAHVAIGSNPRRPCAHLDLDCTPFGNKLKDGTAALEKAAVKLIAANGLPAGAAIELRLVGRINLDRVAFDAESVSLHLEQATGAAAVSINPAGINLGDATLAGSVGGETISRESLERAALRSLIASEHLWGLDGEQEVAADLFHELKEGVHHGRSPQELAETIRTSALVDKVRVALAEKEGVATE